MKNTGLAPLAHDSLFSCIVGDQLQPGWIGQRLQSIMTATSNNLSSLLKTTLLFSSKNSCDGVGPEIAFDIMPASRSADRHHGVAVGRLVGGSAAFPSATDGRAGCCNRKSWLPMKMAVSELDRGWRPPAGLCQTRRRQASDPAGRRQRHETSPQNSRHSWLSLFVRFLRQPITARGFVAHLGSSRPRHAVDRPLHGRGQRAI